MSTRFIWLTIGPLLLAAFIVAGCEEGKPQQNSPRQALALKQIDKLGGNYDLDHDATGDHAVKVSLSWLRLADRDIEFLQALNELVRLYLDGNELTDESLASLKPLRLLKVLCLASNGITDGGVGALART